MRRLFAGCIILDFREVSYVVYASEGAVVRVWGGSIVDNMLLPSTNSSAVFLATALNTEVDIPEAELDNEDTILILQSPAITGNTAPNVITVLHDELLSGEGRARRATVFSSREVPVFHALQVRMAASLMTFRLPTDRSGIDANSEWFVNTYTVRTLLFVAQGLSFCSIGESSLHLLVP